MRYLCPVFTYVKRELRDVMGGPTPIFTQMTSTWTYSFSVHWQRVNTKRFLLIHVRNLAMKLKQYAQVFSMISFKIWNNVLIVKRVTYVLFIRKKNSLNRACDVSVETDNAFCFFLTLSRHQLLDCRRLRLHSWVISPQEKGTCVKFRWRKFRGQKGILHVHVVPSR
jgi:hypothetical protein